MKIMFIIFIPIILFACAVVILVRDIFRKIVALIL